jgi:hypothetical protein
LKNIINKTKEGNSTKLISKKEDFNQELLDVKARMAEY